jgi:hypothetical protein
MRGATPIVTLRYGMHARVAPFIVPSQERTQLQCHTALDMFRLDFAQKAQT